MPANYRTVLFDFDGTLADSYAAITASVNHVRSHHGLPALPEGRVRTLVGHGLLQLMEDIIPGGNPEVDAERYRAHHPTVMYPLTHLLPGVGEALRRLHASGVKMAVCSNKPVAITRKLIESLAIHQYFDAAYGPEDSGNPKPDPAMVFLAMKKLGAKSDESLYVGDMPVDIETARNAGIAVWVVPTGSSDEETLRQAKPDKIMKSMAELPGGLNVK